MWPELFLTLESECEVLSLALASANGALADRQLAGSATDIDAEDPLARYRQLLSKLSTVIGILHEHREEAWAAETLSIVRKALASAARVQGRIVDAAFNAG